MNKLCRLSRSAPPVAQLNTSHRVNFSRAQVPDAVDYTEENRVMSLTMRVMKSVMFKVSRSKHDFEHTVQMVRENALRVGWDVPWRFELQ